MNIIDAVVFGIVAGLVTLKVVLLAAAALLLVHVLTGRARQRKAATARLPARHPKLDIYV